MKKLNCIHISHFKNTDDCKCEKLKIPPKVKIPMSMHMGVPCEPLVKAGDTVLAGQKIGDSSAFFSVPVHSGVSGKVTAVSDMVCANGSVCKCVEIETDGEQKFMQKLHSYEIKDRESLVNAVREGGICGMGGAGFPTHIKLNPKTTVDKLIINAAECEPYITSDNRLMIEKTDDIINGIKMVIDAMNISEAVIAVEKNKPGAISALKEKCGSDKRISIKELDSSYPQGAEKVIIWSAAGRIAGEGKLPSDCGVIVLNVSTAAEIYHFCTTGIPFSSRRLTVDGDAVKKKCNIEVPIGTPVSYILDYAQADRENISELISGGPMMGMCLPSEDYPVTKTMNSLLALKQRRKTAKTACIRCGRCIKACPFGLMPAEIERAYKAKNTDLLKKLKVNLCMNCGCCSYVCPANRNPAELNQLAKTLISGK